MPHPRFLAGHRNDSSANVAHRLMIREAIEKLTRGSDLTEGESAQVMEEIMTGEATPAQFGAFVIALRLKGETVDEMTGLATVMRAKSLKVDYRGPERRHLRHGGRRLGDVQHLDGGGFRGGGSGNCGGEARGTGP